MSDLLIGFVVIMLPVYLCCGLAIFWGAQSASARLSRILRLSGIAWAIWLTAAFLSLNGLDAACDGDVLYGWRNCTPIADDLANTISSVALLSFFGGILYGVLLLIAATITEIVVRRRQNQGSS
ncbi:hypothetical protein V8J82_19000 [Gymnodinialimonas sp. 2305UL16-5]|uniref:hypothetical protein n=1 Tax=Gymnodinialimonas mytili TaxID=3126503 RepID=UPI0030B335CC